VAGPTSSKLSSRVLFHFPWPRVRENRANMLLQVGECNLLTYVRVHIVFARSDITVESATSFSIAQLAQTHPVRLNPIMYSDFIGGSFNFSYARSHQ
jgi:hypothetical protein